MPGRTSPLRSFEGESRFRSMFFLIGLFDKFQLVSNANLSVKADRGSRNSEFFYSMKSNTL